MEQSMKGYTKSAKTNELPEQWYVVDARDQILGRLASDIAYVLRGKHMPQYTPHVDMRTHVVVVNAEKVRLTGDKWLSKHYYHHTMHPGGLKETNAARLNEKKPGELVRVAVQGMLPKNRLGRVIMTHLRVFAGETHDHQAQKPQPLPPRTAKAA
jgi:large subunit ribosomal protein L13